MSIEKMLSRKSMVADPIRDLTEKVSAISASRSFNDDKITGMAIASESLSANDETILTNVYNNIEASIKSIAQDFGIAVEGFQLEAASIGGILAANPKLALSTRLKSVNADYAVIRSDVADGFMERPLAMEAYDERDNRNAQNYSIIYNLLASRQDDFGEALFPTIVVNPNEVGLTISAKIFYVYNDLKRSVTGQLAQYGRKNVIRAYADSAILKNELTKVVPVLRTGGGSDDNTAAFVAVGDVPSWSVNLAGATNVTTGALKIGKAVDLIGISQTNELLNSGIMGPSDTLDTYVKLEAVYVKFTDGTNTDIVRIDIENIPGATFTYAPQGNYRKMIASFDSDGIVMGAATTKNSGGALALLTELSNHAARVRLNINGSISLDKGDCVVNPGKMELVALRDNAGNLVTGGTFTGLATKFDTAEVLGYTLTAYRANSNLRQRGQLLDSQIEYQVIQLPYRSPLAVIMPAINSGNEDNSVLQTLITVTGIRVSNEAVTSLLKARTSLSSYQAVADADGNLPEVSSIGRHYVNPTFFETSLDLSTNVDSLVSHERIKDIRAAIVEKIRFYANEMYRLSEYKAAALVLTGNAGFKPTVIVATDTVIYNYIMADGDLRTLGETFDVKVVSTLDERVKGKVYVTFGVFDSSRNTSVNPLNFGNMLWSPELTVVMPIARDGQTSKEMIVVPRFSHLVNLPILTVLNVSNLKEVTGKQAINMHSV